MSAKLTVGESDYLRSIRNPAKRDYAKRYLEALKAGTDPDAVGHSSELSYMAAQAVRMRLHDITRSESNYRAFMASR